MTADGARLAGRGARFVAVLLDALVSIPVTIAYGILAAGLGQNSSAMTAVGGVLTAVLVLALAIVQIYLLSTTGQTLGKRWMSIRIVKMDGTNPGFVGAFLLRAFLSGLIGVVPAYSLVDILFIFRDDKRCIHDLIAGTRVVAV